MTYQETLDYLFNALPAYHRVGAAAYKANLNNTRALMRHLHYPYRKLRVIHVAGTNGKGSVSHFLASILHKAGYKVGLYTSPHLVDFRERIRINGKMIEKESVVDFVEQHRTFLAEQELSFFEMTVGLAFDYFARQKVDVAVIEVGMGGRLDSTNVVNPLLSIITNISFDHTQFLGNTLKKIAGEKAGIIKRGIPVVIGETHPETAPVFEKRALLKQSDIIFADQHYRVEESQNGNVRMVADIFRDGEPYIRGVHSPMDGLYQRKNIATLCAAVDMLGNSSDIKISHSEFKSGIASVIKDTGLHGRWEKLADRPTLICETAHNEDGILCLVKKLKFMRFKKLHIIYGCVNDKDYGKILDLLPGDGTHAGPAYYFTRPSVQRGLDENILAKEAINHGKKGKTYHDIGAALTAARSAAGVNDLIVVTGSIFLVADLLTLPEFKNQLNY